MNKDRFIEKFAEQFENAEIIKCLHGSTNFKELDEWSSLIALLIICMAYEEYEVTLTREDIRNANTIGDIYYSIKNKAVKALTPVEII